MAVRTLIVDDVPSARMILRNYLSEIGCEIVGEVNSSAAADDVITSATPDLVTLDIHMPEIRGMDSYALFRKIRQNHPAVEFVVISGANYFQNRQEFLKGDRLLRQADRFSRPLQQPSRRLPGTQTVPLSPRHLIDG
jgi:CheY-like chemotaxis protein